MIRQLFDATSSTYTYLVADEASRKAVLIDSVYEQHARDAALVRELGLELEATLDTHCHADHVTGAWLMKNALGSKIGLDATNKWPPETKREWGKLIEMDPKVIAAVTEKWERLGLGK